MNIRQRQALRYAVMQHEGDREIRGAEEHMHAASSTPSLQRFFESTPGQIVMLIVGLALFSIFAPVGVL